MDTEAALPGLCTSLSVCEVGDVGLRERELDVGHGWPWEPRLGKEEGE
jgi:hypothetical protein